MVGFSYSKMIAIGTAVFLIAFSGLVFAVNRSVLPLLPSVVTIKTEGQPTVGDSAAHVQVVVFEEPKCPNCKYFNQTVFPKLKKDFIDTKKIRYTVLPVSFLPNSMPAAAAWLCVYHQEADKPSSDLTFAYIEEMYALQPSEKTDWATESYLIKLAKKSSASINLEELKKCLSRDDIRSQVKKNTKFGNKIMNGELSTPSIYVNGVRMREPSYSAISRQINQAL